MANNVLRLLLVASCCIYAQSQELGKRITVYTISNEETDGLHRLLRSANLFNYDIKVLGIDRGQRSRPLSGGLKVNILAEELKTLCSNPKQAESRDELLMYVDAADTVFVAPPNDVIQSFEKLDASIVMGAELYQWSGSSSLGSAYPDVGPNEYRYLCPTGFIGYAKAICDMILPRTPLAEDDSDQLFYTKIFLDARLQDNLGIKLDSTAEIFQNLDGAFSDVSIKYLGSHSYVYNARTETTPKVLHGNAAVKIPFNRLTDYVPDGYTPNIGCLQCEDDTISLADRKPEEMPLVVLAVFIEQATPFLPSMLEKISKLNYPKEQISLFIHNSVPYHEDSVSAFVSSMQNKKYLEVKLIGSKKAIAEDEARDIAIDICERINCDYTFMLDSLARINNTDTLKLLIEQNKPVLAPLLRRPDELWSNFWGALNTDGYYKDSEDYEEIVKGEKQGLWNVPYINHAMLIKADRLKKLRGAWTYPEKDTDLAVCEVMREKGFFMFVTNMNYFGHLVNADLYNTSRKHPEMWEIERNRFDWEDLYLDPEVKTINAEDDATTTEDMKKYEKCTDAYMFPLFTVKFCQDLIAEMEFYGQWSGGKHQDNRFHDDYYENVPTVDIQMFQIEFETEWLYILKTYVGPYVAKTYTGYSPRSESVMNFVAKYQPHGLDRLRPHFDASTFSINVALSKVGIDFEGGGTRFVRYDCAITDQKQGSVMVFPGQFTHWHEGLKVTKGTRYIAVSFVDP